MMRFRKAAERGDANHGWLKSKHTFSFADYFDEKNMGFGPLRVINEDRIEGGTGFGTHGHRDMEILSYVVSGELKHKDSMGNEAVIRPGELQRMSAGTGVRHSEMNALPDTEAHFLQIWILPEAQGTQPGYGQKDFSPALERGELVLLASRDGRDGSIQIQQDVDLYGVKSKSAGSVQCATKPARKLWVQVVRGEVEAAGQRLAAGDGLALSEIQKLDLSWKEDSELLFFDMK